MTKDAKKFLAYVAAGILALSILGVILSSIGSFGPVVGDNKTYEVTGEIKTLEVEISAADFRIEEGDKFLVESNLKKLTFKQSGDKLVLKERSSGNKNYNNASLVIYVPEGTVFENVDITTGAGRFSADALLAEKLDLEFGAGEVNIGELTATREADIESGAGQITIKGGSLNNLSLEMGVGELNLTSSITGRSELDLGVGEANINLLGTIDDYTVEMTKGIGSLTFDGEILSSGKKVGTGDSKIGINGGIGQITISFK